MASTEQSTVDRVFVVGSINTDLLLDVERFPRRHEKIRASGWAITQGGAGANTAYWLARLGQSVALISAVGSDECGDRAIADLQASGVDTDLVLRMPDEKTGSAVVVTRGTDKRMITLGGADRAAAMQSVSPAAFAGNTHLHLVGDTSKGGAELVRLARAQGATVSVDFNGRDMRHITDDLDLAILNLDELRRLPMATSSLDAVERAAGLGIPNGGWVVVTLGSKGVVAVSPDAVVRVASRRTRVVDRTGAGDAFCAGLLDSYLRTRNIEWAMRSGVALASVVLGSMGSRGG